MEIPESGLQAAKADRPIVRSNVARVTCGRRQKGLAIVADRSGSCRHSGRQGAQAMVSYAIKLPAFRLVDVPTPATGIQSAMEGRSGLAVSFLASFGY